MARRKTKAAESGATQPNDHRKAKRIGPPVKNEGSTGSKNHFAQSADNYGIGFKHTENEYADFDREKLIFQMHSTDGPRMAAGDVNGDKLQDFYICGAKDQPGALYIQTAGWAVQKEQRSTAG
jgi:hypothetical protein